MSLVQSIKTTFNLKNATPKFNILDQCNWVATGLYQATVYYKIVNPIGVIVFDGITGNSATETPLTCTIAQTGGTATVTAANHGYSVGDTIVVTGATQSGYNIVGTVLSVPTSGTFTYAVASGTVSPATTSTHLQCMKLNFDTVLIPLQSGSNLPIQGTYTITQQVTINTTTTSVVFTYDFGYAKPVVGISQAINCFTPAFQSADYTTYTYNGITPTINRTHNITSASVNFTGTAAIETLYYPQVFNETYTTTISTDLTYVFTDTLNVYDNVTGTKTLAVQCDVNLGSINCCLNIVNQEYQSLVGVNDFLALQKYDILNRALQLKQLYESNIAFGNYAEASLNIAEIYRITGCSPSCNCNDTTNQVLPYQAILGRAIQFLSSTDTAPQYSVGDYVNYDDGVSQNFLYRVLENTNVGDSPETAPTKFKFVG